MTRERVEGDRSGCLRSELWPHTVMIVCVWWRAMHLHRVHPRLSLALHTTAMPNTQ